MKKRQGRKERSGAEEEGGGQERRKGGKERGIARSWESCQDGEGRKMKKVKIQAADEVGGRRLLQAESRDVSLVQS